MYLLNMNMVIEFIKNYTAYLRYEMIEYLLKESITK